VVSQIVPVNPAAPVKGPSHVVKRGKTPVLSVEDARTLLASIPTDSLQGLRDRALIGVMLFSFARVSAVLGMKVSDFYENGTNVSRKSLRWDWRLEANLNRKANGLALEGPFCGTLRTFVGI
jgi:site-specific recombinase XerC